MPLIFYEKLIIMEKISQQSPHGLAAIWADGEEIEAKLSISNMRDVLVAQAQGVQATGYLIIDVDKNGKTKYPLTMGDYLKYQKGGFYLRVADMGVIEAGEAAVFKERQFAVESLAALPCS